MYSARRTVNWSRLLELGKAIAPASLEEMQRIRELRAVRGCSGGISSLACGKQSPSLGLMGEKLLLCG